MPNFFTRRQLLAATAASPIVWGAPGLLAARTPPLLGARAGTAMLRGDGQAPTAVWGYDGQVPGPTLRARQGERFVVEFANALPEPTTIHWHGVRVPFAMDGVPDLTQKAIAPGERFVYDFVPPDAGTYWYHPHANSAEQLGRGLAGALIVEERAPPQMDRDLVWLLSDWKLRPDGTIDPDFKNRHEAEHEGRLGQFVTVNGAPAQTLAVRRHERVRLRLVNVANARIFELEFAGADPWLVALDGNPVPPRRLGQEKFRLGPGMRADLMLDGDWSAAATLRFHPPAQDPRPLATFAISREAPLREAALPPPAALPPNPIAEPDLAKAERIAIVFGGGGGAMHHGRHGQHGGPMHGGMNEPVWTVNGRREDMHAQHQGAPPLFTLKRGASYVAVLKNDTSFDHPIHLHGMSFRTIARNGKPEPARHFTDTILMAQQETAEIAFVADNAGDWMLHCHILEHQDSGMSAILRVA